MTLAPARLIPLILLLLSSAVAALLLFTASANAAWPVSSPIKRGNTTVGQASGMLIVAPEGFAVANVRISRFTAPRRARTWRARTVLSTYCAEPDFDASEGPGDPSGTVSVVARSAWRQRRIDGTVGSWMTQDLVKQCPDGMGPGGSLRLTLVIRDLADTRTVGFAQLFAAG
jgi:hypothetical protein